MQPRPFILLHPRSLPYGPAGPSFTLAEDDLHLSAYKLQHALASNVAYTFTANNSPDTYMNHTG